ncbi:MAG: hypothetical protein WCT08_03540 [Patescibacteria group bacterium]
MFTERTKIICANGEHCFMAEKKGKPFTSEANGAIHWEFENSQAVFDESGVVTKTSAFWAGSDGKAICIYCALEQWKKTHPGNRNGRYGLPFGFSEEFTPFWPSYCRKEKAEAEAAKKKSRATWTKMVESYLLKNGVCAEKGKLRIGGIEFDFVVLGNQYRKTVHRKSEDRPKVEVIGTVTVTGPYLEEKGHVVNNVKFIGFADEWPRGGHGIYRSRADEKTVSANVTYQAPATEATATAAA